MQAGLRAADGGTTEFRARLREAVYEKLPRILTIGAAGVPLQAAENFSARVPPYPPSSAHPSRRTTGMTRRTGRAAGGRRSGCRVASENSGCTASGPDPNQGRRNRDLPAFRDVRIWQHHPSLGIDEPVCTERFARNTPASSPPIVIILPRTRALGSCVISELRRCLPQDMPCHCAQVTCSSPHLISELLIRSTLVNLVFMSKRDDSRLGLC